MCDTWVDLQSLVKTYIAIDTNILLDHLHVVQALLRVLSIPTVGGIQILIPLTVLYGRSIAASELKRQNWIITTSMDSNTSDTAQEKPIDF